MMKILRLQKDKKIEDNIIKDVRKFFRSKTEIDDTTMKDVRNLFRLKKEIDDTIIKKEKRDPFRFLKQSKTE